MSLPTSPVSAPASFHLQTRFGHSGTAVVAVAGEVDMATAPDLHAALLDALVVHRPAVIDVDLSACTFLDCSGIRVLIAAHTTARAIGCQVRVRHPRRFVRLVLEVTGLLDMFTAPDDGPDDVAGQPASGHDAAISASGLLQPEPAPCADAR
jgi:anti-sigma B factor antagonist